MKLNIFDNILAQGLMQSSAFNFWEYFGISLELHKPYNLRV